MSSLRHLVQAMAAVTDADRRSYIAQHVSADLQYVRQDNEVSLQNQYLLAQHYKSLKVKASEECIVADGFSMAQCKAERTSGVRKLFCQANNSSMLYSGCFTNEIFGGAP